MNLRKLTYRIALCSTVCLAVSWPGSALAVLSETAGTGVWEVQSAESQRPARLELGIFTAYQRLSLRDSANTKLNGLQGGVNGVFGFPGGLELSGTLPVYGFYTTVGSGRSPIDQDITARLGDLTSRLRWTGRLFHPGLRWGLEGEITFATGDDEEVVYQGRGPVNPYTIRDNDYAGRVLLTWDGLRAGSSVPLRLHANAAYRLQGDETRFLVPHAPLPLELGAPLRNRDNDLLSLGAAVEFDLPRLTLFGEFVTDQFVNERARITSRENRMAISPGARFWMPGGVSLAVGYTFNISDDDAATAFNPDRAFPNSEWRASFSLGTVYRGARARAVDAGRAVQTPAPVVTARPTPPPAAAPTPTAPVVADTARAAKKQEQAREILSRRPVQDEPLVQPKPEPVRVRPVVQPTPPPTVPPVVQTSPPGGPAGLRDTDGDGIPDDHDLCPLLAEDRDGFADLDGCPDLDNDNDGIPDVRDQCPNDPETFNGYYDFDGCPDQLPIRWLGPTGSQVSPPTPAASPWVGVDTMRASVMRPAPAQRESASLRSTVSAADLSAPAHPRQEAGMIDTLRTALDAERVRSARLERNLTERQRLTQRTDDSLRITLVAEQQRRSDLEARFAQTEGERRQLLAALMDSTRKMNVIPPPMAITPSSQGEAVAFQQALEFERQRSKEMENRLRALELERSQLLATQLNRPAGTTGPPTVITTPRTRNEEMAVRLAAIEGELRRIKEDQGAPMASANTAPATTTTPATPVVASAGDTNSEQILRRILDLQSSIDSLQVKPPARVTPATDRSRERDAAEAASDRLDAMLPLLTSRTFPEIQFATGRAELTSDALGTLNTIAMALRGVPRAHVQIVGHTDDVGRASVNLQLSRRRAQAVANRLYEHGVGRDQITVEGRGEESPLTDNATPEGRRANRRVEFIRTQ